jgi:8-oxo-dGTP diphosphatase
MTKDAAAEKLRMVVGFMFNENETDVLLIQKSKPAWQKGRFNGIGGKCEKGESYLEAMRREFEEETGIEHENWQFVTVMSGDDWIVTVFTAQSDDVFNYETMEDEPVCLIPIQDLDKYDHILNLQWLIPMCLDKFLDYSVSNTEYGASLQPKEAEPTGYIGDKIKKEMEGYRSYNHPARKVFNDVCWRLYGQTFDSLCENEGNQQSGFWLDIILPAMEQYRKQDMEVEGIKWVKASESDYPEDTECCLWCRVPIIEPPYVGSTSDEYFQENYYTHFMRLQNSFFPHESPDSTTANTQPKEQIKKLKSIWLLEALLKGSTLVRDFNNGHNQTLWCDWFEGRPHFYVDGWGSGFGSAMDRVIGIIETNGEGWSIELQNVQECDTTESPNPTKE